MKDTLIGSMGIALGLLTAFAAAPLARYTAVLHGRGAGFVRAYTVVARVVGVLCVMAGILMLVPSS